MPAWAQNQKPQQKLTKKTSKKPFARFAVGIHYSSGDEIKYVGSTQLFTGRSNFTASEKTNPAVGLGVSYMRLKPWSVGFDTGLLFESQRTSQGIVANVGGTQMTGTRVGSNSMMLLTALANVNFSFGFAYLLAGFNYPFVINNDSNSKMSGLIGYQAGFGVPVFEDFTIEASYRLLGIKGTISGEVNLDVDEANMVGFLIGARYFF
jgi:hypothetical protein